MLTPVCGAGFKSIELGLGLWGTHSDGMGFLLKLALSPLALPRTCLKMVMQWYNYNDHKHQPEYQAIAQFRLKHRACKHKQHMTWDIERIKDMARRWKLRHSLPRLRKKSISNSMLVNSMNNMFTLQCSGSEAMLPIKMNKKTCRT